LGESIFCGATETHNVVFGLKIVAMRTKTKNKERSSLDTVQSASEAGLLATLTANAPEAAPVADGRFTERSEYLDERKLIIQLKDGASQRFDQILTALSSAALGFSILIGKDLLKMPDVKLQYLLICAWIMWFASLVSVLISLLSSEYVLSRMLDNVDAEYQNQPSKSSWLGTLTQYINVVSLLFFFLGALLFLVFTGNNFEWRVPVINP
jgi:hypothetical protein